MLFTIYDLEHEAAGGVNDVTTVSTTDDHGISPPLPLRADLSL